MDSNENHPDSTVSPQPAEAPAASAESSPPVTTAPETKIPERPAAGPRKDKETMEDFATALETFTAETEAQAHEDHVLKGTVLKITPTHVVVDIGSKSEGLVPIAQLQDHEGNPKVQPGDEINVMVERGENDRL